MVASLTALLRQRLRPTRHSRVSLYSVACALPLGVMIFGARTAWPAFVFEHLMVLLVVAFAVAGGRGPALVAAATGSLGNNRLLSEPIGLPAITGFRDAIDFGLFMAVALIVGWLVDGLRAARAHATEAAARERRAREERDRLVATITHDLATPLSVIRGTVRVFRTRGAVSVDAVKLLARVETAATRAISLVRTLADTQSLDQQSLSLALRPVDLRTIVEPIANMLDSTSDRHPIVLDMDATPLVIDGDSERLGRVVENLITNAIKYSPDGGRVEIALGRDDGWATFTVRDHGIGLPPDATERIFALGYRAPQAVDVAPGLGLGLYTASEVIRRHGGTIAATTMASGGAMFTVRLPLAPQPSSSRARGSACELTTSAFSRTVH